MPRVFSNREKMAEAARELRQRKHVYPRLIDSGKLTREAAARQISLMEDMVNDYKARAAQDTPDLFATPAPELANLLPVVCYFPTERDREEFIAAVLEVKPGMQCRKG